MNQCIYTGHDNEPLSLSGETVQENKAVLLSIPMSRMLELCHNTRLHSETYMYGIQMSYLKRNSFFGKLPSDVLENLCQILKLKSVSCNSTLFKQGTRLKHGLPIKTRMYKI
jgi:hypothetical protein